MSQYALVNRDVERVISNLRKIGVSISAKEKKAMLEKEAPKVINAARSNITNSKKPHIRYRANGSKVIYYPGNLRNSIQILRFKRSPDIWVGPKTVKRARAKSYGKTEKRVDGYYAHFVEFGTVKQQGTFFMKRAYSRTKQSVLNGLLRSFSKRLEKEINKVSI